MLPKRARLTRELIASLSVSRGEHSPHFMLKRFSPSPLSPDVARLGVTVSKKVARQAVDRNRIRRRVYAVVAPFMPRLPAGLYQLVAKVGADRLNGDTLAREIATLLKTR